MQSHLTHSHNHHSHNCNHASQSNIAPKAHHHHHNDNKLRTSVQVSQPIGDRYLDLQRKIQLLQSENQVLKQHLVYEI